MIDALVVVASFVWYFSVSWLLNSIYDSLYAVVCKSIDNMRQELF